MTLADISRITCKEYSDQRGSDAAARRELEDLRSAVNIAIADGLCRHTIIVTVPDAPPKRTGFLEPFEVAKLLWKAYSQRKTFKGKANQTSSNPSRCPLHYPRSLYGKPLGPDLASVVRPQQGVCKARESSFRTLITMWSDTLSAAQPRGGSCRDAPTSLRRRVIWA